MKYKFKLQNLDCANCAREIEEFLAKQPNFTNVIVNFNTMRLGFESHRKITLAQVNQLIQKVEPETIAINLDEKVIKRKTYSLSVLIVGFALGLLTYFLPLPDFIKIPCLVLVYAILLYRTASNAVKLLIKSHIINENALITISCIGALLIGETLEGMMVITLYIIGKILEEHAVDSSRRSVQDLISLKTPYATIRHKDKTSRIKVEKIQVGDIIIIKKGDKVPVDGKIISSHATLDMSALTGESLPVEIRQHQNILSGSINLGEPIEIKTTKTFSDSTIAHILDLLEAATDRKAKTETIVSRISKYYTPIILLLAILVVIILPIFFQVPFESAIYRSLTFLVISCPCAIAISVPLAYFTGIGTASKLGILIKGSNYLDNLSNAKQIIFDKTGTLTNGIFAVRNIKIFDQTYSESEIIDLVSQGEALSAHPIAKSILALASHQINTSKVKNFQETSGRGISYQIDQCKIVVGNQLACKCQENATLHVNINGKHVASIFISDQIKPNSAQAITALKQLGFTIHMFTGDKQQIAESISRELNIDQLHAEMLPTDKFHQFEAVSQKNSLTIFVGDGINDAPVLRRADIGIAMGGIGSEAAIEAADIVIMNDDLLKIPQAIKLSRYTKKIIYQNLIFAILIKLLILFLSIFGLANMWWAVFADTGVTLLAILNTLRILYKFHRK